jgi:hypothetical protein
MRNDAGRTPEVGQALPQPGNRSRGDRRLHNEFGLGVDGQSQLVDDSLDEAQVGPAPRSRGGRQAKKHQARSLDRIGVGAVKGEPVRLAALRDQVAQADLEDRHLAGLEKFEAGCVGFPQPHHVSEPS